MLNKFEIRLILKGRIMNTYIEQVKLIPSLLKGNADICQFKETQIKIQEKGQ
jgi:hypothetical protein